MKLRFATSATAAPSDRNGETPIRANSLMHAAPAARKLSPLKILAWASLAYVLLAGAVDAGVIRTPQGNFSLQMTLLALLGVAFIFVAEAALALMRAIPVQEMLGWPFRAAAVAAVAYSIKYGDRVFINSWFYDDWGYLVPQPLRLTHVQNDHFVPLLNFVFWAMRRVFGFDYIGAACLQQTAFLAIVLVLAHLLWSGTRRPWVLILLVAPFAMWPSYGIARTWFAGGFWLTASAALLSVYVLQAQRFVFQETLRFTDLAASFVLAAATVFISSQTLVPAVYLAAFCAPALLFLPAKIARFRRLGILCAISLAPTAVAFWGRSIYVVRAPLNPSGLLDGSVFSNLAIFILNKAFFVLSLNASQQPALKLYLTIVYWVCGLALLAAGIKLAASKSIDAVRRASLAGLIVGGCVEFVLPLIQIGLARRWNFDAVLNPYYVTLPFLGFWLACAGIVVSLFARPKQQDKSALSAWAAALASVTVVVAAIYSRGLQPDEQPLTLRIQRMQTERQFIDSLGAAACDLAALHSQGPPVHWTPAYDFPSCRVCQDFIGPPQFLHDLHFDSVVGLAARHSCPIADVSAIDGSRSQPGAVTDGAESPAAVSFVRHYLAQ